MNNNGIYWIPRKVTNPSVRLFCFPYAGGSASTYYSWINEFDCDVELVLIQPPGRGARVTQQPHQKMGDYIAELMQERDILTTVPAVFFGHSLGSRVAYQLCCELSDKSLNLPLCLIASGSRAAHLEQKRNNEYLQCDEAFKQELQSLHGTPKPVLENDELMKMLLPALKADFGIADSFVSAQRSLDIKIVVLSGTEDNLVSHAQIDAWRHLSIKECDFVTVNGDHFFIDSNALSVIHSVKKILKKDSEMGRPVF